MPAHCWLPEQTSPPSEDTISVLRQVLFDYKVGFQVLLWQLDAKLTADKPKEALELVRRALERLQ